MVPRDRNVFTGNPILVRGGGVARAGVLSEINVTCDKFAEQ